jgi:hypothetical protein
MVRNALHVIIFDSVEPWTFQLLGFEEFQVRLQKKPLESFFYRDTQRRDFRPLEDKLYSYL